MKPLNQKERNNLFFQFLVFYVVSIIVVLFAAFGNIQMNQKQNEKLKADIDKLRKEMKSSEDFYVQMRKVEGIITEATTPEARRNLDVRFQKEKQGLADLAYKQDSSRMQRLGWYEIINGYNQRWEDKANITDQDRLLGILAQRDATIKQNDKDYKTLESEFDNYKRTHY
jgi:hypothetical protein